MENAHTDHDQRLRAHGERLLTALEAQDPPGTYADILRAARALIAVKKALDLLYKEAEAEPRAVRAPKATAKASAEEPAAEEDNEEPPVLNRQMRRLAEALARKEAQRNLKKPGDYRRHASG